MGMDVREISDLRPREGQTELNSAREMQSTMQRSSLVKAAWATLLFGSVPACIRAMEMDSYALGIWRLGLATVGMTVFLALRRKSPVATIVAEVRRDWPVLML